MACSYCGSLNNLNPVSNLVYANDSGSVNFCEVLAGCSIINIPGFQYLICNDCYNSVTKFFAFKAKIKKNCLDEIFKEISNFLSSSSEQVTCVSHHSCLSIVPNSRRSLMRNFVDFNPTVDLEIMAVASVYSNVVVKQEPMEDSMEFDEQFELIPEHGAESVEDENEDHLLVDQKHPSSEPQVEHSNDVGKRKLRSSSTKKPQEFCKDIIEAGKYRFELNEQEQIWLDRKIALSKIGYNNFICNDCDKLIRSPQGIKYHIISQHRKSGDSAKDSMRKWVSEKIKKAQRLSEFPMLNCDQCHKTFASAPAIRYHLSRHFLNGETKSRFKKE